MGETIQPGAQVDKETYERFKQFVEDTHGRVRGSLGDELETAMQERMNAANGADPMTRIEDDIATIKAQLVDAESDGGTPAPTPDAAADTHTRGPAKPAPNQPREAKIEYLIGRLFADSRPEDPDGGQLAPREIRNVITDTYAFDEAIVDEYVADIQERLADVYDAEPHPRHGQTIVWGEKLDDVQAELRDEARTELDEVAGGIDQ